MSKISSSSSPVVMKDVVHKLQLCLLEGIKSETQLFVAGSLLSKSDYHDVVTERSIAQMCGHPLCPNLLPSPREDAKKGKYRISLKEHKVYDLLEMRMYCSTKCVVDSRAYAGSLQEERSLALDTSKIDKVVRLFEGLNLKAEEGLGDNGDFGLRNLSIKEKEDGAVVGGVVSLEEWIGPSNAIEGYTPQHDRSSKNRPGSNRKDPKLKREEEGIFGEMDFTSTIITQDDGYSISKEASGGTKNTRKKTKHKGRLKISSCNVPETTSTDKESQPSCSGLKSSLKSSSSATSRRNRSVSWADDGEHNQRLCDFSEKQSSSSSSKSIDDDGDGSFRLASAEACAAALSQAAEAVASGESDAPDAVSEAGLVILPPPHPADENESVSEGAIDPEPARIKWPKKTGITESDFFDSEDSWFDSPPEEFVLDLSPFATMFMSLFAWISCSSLGYVYGGDEEKYASVNGREYPRMIVLEDGRSAEIKKTLAACLSRALPGLVRHLRLPTPVSTIEYGMGCLLETMSFLDPLPALRVKQWQVIVLLFIEALSVCRIPAMAPHLTNPRTLFQKVFDDAQISGEEYELLRDVILPLGRVPQFATQSGG